MIEERGRKTKAKPLKTFGFMAIVALAATAVVSWFFFMRPGVYTGPVERVTIGVARSISPLLVYVAEKKGFFSKHGVEAELVNYEAGALAVDDLISGRLDIMTAAEFVFVAAILDGKDLRTFATIGTSNNSELIARKDRGIRQPSDLRGKRIGVAKGTAVEFFLRTFLAFNGIADSEVQTVDLKPSQLPDAVFSGSVDAAVTYPPFAPETKRPLGTNEISWPVQHEQEFFFLLITGSSFTEKRAEAAKRVLGALIDAEHFVAHHPDESRTIVMDRLMLGPEDIGHLWPSGRFQLMLPQNLLILMEDEARWIMRNRGASGKMPDFFSRIDLEPMESVKPIGVGVIH